MTDVWTIVGSVGGAIGGIAGVVALVFAYRADQRSKDTEKQANRSLKLSTDANTLSAESNSLAVDAKQLAEEANTISRRRETRETERHDVAWEIERVEAGQYRVVNVGEDEAHRVSIVFRVDDEESRGEAELVKPGRFVDFDMPGARQALANEVAEYRARRKRENDTGVFFAMPIQPSMEYAYHVVGARIVWETALGSQRTKEIDEPLSSLQDWN